MVRENLINISKDIPEGVKLVAVSKTKPIEILMEAYDAGQRIFGENKVQDMAAKYELLPKDIQWHFIGHLQTNKVKFLAPFVHMIEAVDSLKILAEINKQAKKAERIISCLLQFHVAEEESKFGLSMDEVKDILESDTYGNFEHVKIAGVMGMATYTDDEDQIRREFRILRNAYRELKVTYFSEKAAFKEISMGMSGDYKIAIQEGSTMVRIGSLIFGARNY